MADPVVLIDGDAYAAAPYDFGLTHPMAPIRVALTMALIRASGLHEAPGVSLLAPRMATEEELSLVHDPDYLTAVQILGGAGLIPPGWQIRAASFGFRSQDNPVFTGMYDASALVAGGTLVAAEAITDGSALHAFVPMGGLHHAQRARAAGFCVFNDVALAIATIRARSGGRVAYIDIDAHHGDGVQAQFYNDPDVLTISFHESGQYLYPGTGFVQDIGTWPGRGYSVNVPLDPYTSDGPFLRAVGTLVPPLLRAFKPDVLVTQCGCDSHWRDTVTHLATTTNLWPRLGAIFHDLAHELCGGRWLATGGGGFDLYNSVPRAWTMLFAAMIDAPLPDRLPDAFLDLRDRYVSDELPLTFADRGPAPVTRDPLFSNQQVGVEASVDRAIAEVREAIYPVLGVPPGA